MRKMILFMKSVLIGIALVLPGLSGSLMAVLLGMYETIVTWMSSVRKNIINLSVLALGTGIGILLSAKLVLSICVRYPIQSNWFFLGLVAGGLPVLIGHVREKYFTVNCIPVMLLGFIGVFTLSVLSPAGGAFQTSIDHVRHIGDGMRLLLAGFVSCGLMMLPGVSGSVLLILMGQYGTVYGAISDLSVRENWLRVMPICLLFGIGGLLGVLLVSNLMRRALRRYDSGVQWLILGLTSGTCAALVWICLKQSGGTPVSLIWAVIGFGLTVLTGKLERHRALRKIF